ncbi:MAG: hypothetical protein ABI591_08075 [Kofleriaceae bacterium]
MKTTTLLLLSLVAVAACGSKPKTSTTPANKTGTSDTKGSMGGTGYGGGSAMTPANPTSGGDPCAN